MDGETIELDFGWRATLDPQDRWLCVRLHPENTNLSPGHGLIERLWETVDSRGAHNVVLEMNDVTFLPSSLMGELVRLHKRLATHNGRLRLSGLRSECAEALHVCRLDRVLPTFRATEDALLH